MDRRVPQVGVGDRVIACGVHRGEVVLVAKSRAWMLVRVVAGEPTRSGYLLCRPAEAERMNGWWTRRLRHDGRVGTRAWARGADRPVEAGRALPLPALRPPAAPQTVPAPAPQVSEPAAGVAARAGRGSPPVAAANASLRLLLRPPTQSVFRGEAAGPHGAAARRAA